MAQTATRRGVDWGWVLSNTAVASAFLLFAWAHFAAWRATGWPAGLGLMLQEGLVAVLLLARRRTARNARDPRAWLATGIGSFGMLLARPTAHAVAGAEPLWMGMQLAGVVVALVSLLSLGRSFGLVAAHRGIKTGGAYRVVRHPVYAGYLLGHLGYVLENPSLPNLGLLVLVWGCQLLRIRQEEQFLAADPAYVAYQGRVRWRLIPFLY